MAPATKPPLPIRTIRSEPHLYSAVCRAQLWASRRLGGAEGRKVLQDNSALFAMNEMEQRHTREMKENGFTILHDFFPTDVIDGIYEKADRLFRDLQLDFGDAYSVQHGERESLEGVSYEELAATEKMISLRDPLVQIPEMVPLAFNETILKIVTNFLGYVPPRFKPMAVRDFPADRPRESSNFHRDNDESDSAQFFIYLVDIDDSRGPLIYIPGTHRYDVKSCRPRLARDLGIQAADGRYTDEEIEKHYPREEWVPVKAKRGSVAIIHGNGFHKGPAWPSYGEGSNNLPRTALRFDAAGKKWRGKLIGQERKIAREDFEGLTPLQDIYARDFTVVEREPVAV